MKTQSMKTRGAVDCLRLVLVLSLGMGLLMISNGAMAADEMGDGICAVVNLLNGKFLFGFGMLAVLGSGAALLFGGEITDGLKKVATIIAVIGIILAASSLFKLAFSAFASQSC